MSKTNVHAEVKGNKLVLTIDLTEKHGLSSTGKTEVIGSSGGFAGVDGHAEVFYSLNVNKKVPK